MRARANKRRSEKNAGAIDAMDSSSSSPDSEDGPAPAVAKPNKVTRAKIPPTMARKPKGARRKASNKVHSSVAAKGGGPAEASFCPRRPSTFSRLSWGNCRLVFHKDSACCAIPLLPACSHGRHDLRKCTHINILFAFDITNILRTLCRNTL